MLADYHVHSAYSDDSTYPMEQVVRDAIRINLDELCFTEHVDYGVKPDWDQPAGARFEDTGYSYTLSLIAGKYKPIILYCLMEYEPVRFNEMQRYLGRVADKTLSQNLRELERDGLIHRELFPEVPPRVEYTLTARGQSLVSVLDRLCDWGMEHRNDG